MNKKKYTKPELIRLKDFAELEDYFIKNKKPSKNGKV